MRHPVRPRPRPAQLSGLPCEITVQRLRVVLREQVVGRGGRVHDE
ncbi:MAG TPA: hypothetical protein VJT49_15280 [Amycolatopsis sp.]|nr:hypothetical protein [Amycolatopsis sp.]HKS46441.1 hypothetical protein [Amycolatopsis sp.]